MSHRAGKIASRRAIPLHQGTYTYKWRTRERSKVCVSKSVLLDDELISRGDIRLFEVLDKGKAAAVTSIVETKDKHTGKVIFENQSTVFIRGAGGFGGKRNGKGRQQSHPP